MVEYAKTSLLFALSRCLPFNLHEEIIPCARLTLDQVLVKLQRYFNSPAAQLDAVEAALDERKYKTNLVFVIQIMILFTEVLTFNNRCGTL